MSNWQDVAKILGKDKTPQEQRLIHDYMASQETSRSVVSGGGTVRADRLEAGTGKWQVSFPFEGARVMRDVAQTITTGTYTDVIEVS